MSGEGAAPGWLVSWDKKALDVGPARYPPVDQCGMSEEDWRWVRWEYRNALRKDRLGALRMLWGRPIIRGRLGYVRSRGEEWSFWRAVKASIGILLDRRHRDAHGKPWLGLDLGHWDYRSCGCGGCSWSAMVLELHPRCRVDIRLDSD